MNLQYIQNKKGKVTAVVVPIKDWERIVTPSDSEKDIKKDDEKLKKAKEKNKLKAKIAKGFQEAQLYLDRKIELKDARELLDEL
jgi:hypothetical protein